MSHRISFGWVLHQHQPIGNFPWVFAEVYDACYDPLLAALERHPGVRVNLHYSGPLIDWFIAERPEYLHRLAVLVQRGQVEMLTGGYYEPILPIIPESDQQGQIFKMNSALRQHFGSEPTGLWLAERVWEPTLPSSLARAGVAYTILDDSHFLMAGLQPDDLYGSYMTEDLGMPLRLFPNPQVMREIIPWHSVPKVEQQFRQLADATRGPERLVVMADDGEKFGSWPDTYDRIWKRGYMEQFLTMLEANADWLQTVLLGEYSAAHPPLGRVYLPTASYSEMMEWALPVERQIAYEQVRKSLITEDRMEALSFLRGGMWRNFFAKYPESNNFHKKMLRVHTKIRAASALLGPIRNQEALNFLWKAQCNCGYWHGVFGGIYLADIRSAIYRNLIQAETLAESVMLDSDSAITITDFDDDGREELLIEGPQLNLYCAPHDGGTIFELDWRAGFVNVVDTLARRPEAYHRKLLTGNILVVPPRAITASSGTEIPDSIREEAASIHEIVQAKEAGLERLLHYDAYRRSLLRDHFFSADFTAAEFVCDTAHDDGDFANGIYEYKIEGVGIDALVVDLCRDGTVHSAHGPIAVRVRKMITISTREPELRISYTIHNTGLLPLQCVFAIENNWGLLGGGGNPTAWYTVNGRKPVANYALDATGCDEDVQSLQLMNTSLGTAITLNVGTPAGLWRFPIETVSNSEAGFERGYQCSCTVLRWLIDVPPGDRWSVSFGLHIGIPEL